MLTLYKATQLVKNTFKWSAILIGGILVILFLIRGGISLYKVFFPKPPTPPNVAFGKLPRVSLPKSVVSNKFTYTIDTVSGNLGYFPNMAKVYAIIPKQPNLLNLEITRLRAQKINFTADEKIISDTVYSWRDSSIFKRKITFNIVSSDFSITSDYLRTPFLFKGNTITPQEAINLAESTLKSMDLLPEDIDLSKTTTQLLTLQNSTLFPATSLSTTQLIRVDFFQKNIDRMPIFYPKPPFSTMYFLIGGTDSRGEIVEGQFYHQTISNQSATYPLKLVEQAFKELQSGKGSIAAYYGTSNEIVIKNVFLGYYLGSEKQQYLIPIYIFEGKDGFYGYVSAIEDEWFSDDKTQTLE
ncbi:MAG: hypothetical protein KatS3mg089_0316 [Patescibacteria group bacterium]|nr:MAG: hypothetical protein KatS3mg089_0316 [Patescibacteria group bacterium]